MPDPSRYPDTRDDSGADTGVEPDRKSTTSTSRWQKVVGILGIVVVLWVGDEMLDNVFDRGPGGGGGHGPGQGEPPADQEQGTDTDDGGGHGPPEGDH